MTVDRFLYSYIAKEESYADGAIIIEQGVKGDWVYVILKGRAKVKKRTEKGMVTLYKLKEGDIFGEIAFLERGEKIRSASVIAAEGSVRVGILDSELLTKEYGKISPQLRDLLKTLIVKLKNSTDKVCSIMAAS
jgi:CRP-like cAMP-binding protein